MASEPYIVAVYLDSKPKDTFVFEFSSGDYVALAETTWQRNTQYNGCKYHIWLTNKAYARSADRIKKEEVPYTLSQSEIYVENRDNGPVNNELLEAIVSEYE